MNFVTLSICIALALVACSVDGRPQAMRQRFNQWATRFGFAHEPAAMREKRFKIFQQNVEQIDEQNEKYQKGESTYYSDINRFTAMTEEEREQFRGHKEAKPEKSNKRALTTNQVKYSGTVYTAFKYSKSLTAPVNTFKNWTTTWTFAPENQGQCGSCWTFATTAVIDAAYKIKKNVDVVTSKECLVECSKTFNNQCHGGNVLMALDYVQANGIASQASYPYTSTNLTDQPATCKLTTKQTYATVLKYFIVDSDEEAIRQAVDEYGPVAVSVDASSAFQSYAGGVFDGVCTTSTNHAVVIVGYGSDAATGVQYWIVRNSWGSTKNPQYYPYTINYVDSTGKIVKTETTYKAAPAWGENGHIRIRRGVNKCGIASFPVGAVVV